MVLNKLLLNAVGVCGLLVLLGILACREVAKKDSVERGQEKSQAQGITYSKKFVPKLRSVFSIISKIMVVAEKTKGKPIVSQTVSSVLEDLMSETSITEVKVLGENRSEVRVNPIFSRMIAEKKADITFLISGEEADGHFNLDSLIVEFEDLKNGVKTGNIRQYSLVRPEKNNNSTPSYVIELSELEKISKELHILNPKIRPLTVSGNVSAEISKGSMSIASSEKLILKDDSLIYLLHSLKITIDFDSPKPIQELSLEAEFFENSDKETHFATIKFNSKNLDISELDQNFIVNTKQ